MEYPDKNKIHIYVCDDGDRLEIKDLTIKINVNYISRSNRKDAKAGNYNNALLKTTSPYIATFDSDMAPTKDFLLTTLPFFYKEKNLIQIQIIKCWICSTSSKFYKSRHFSI